MKNILKIITLTLLLSGCSYFERANENEVKTTAAQVVSAQSSYFSKNKTYGNSLKDIGVTPEGDMDIQIQEASKTKFQAVVKSERSPTQYKIEMTPENHGPSAIKKVSK
jgi:PBP1b-binding outer membrane lipoprotein LpoB